MAGLRSFLDTKRVDGSDWNITGMGGLDVGKYYISDDDYDKFLELTYKSIFVNKQACSLLEKHCDNGPLLIDLDFRYEPGGLLKRRYNDDHLLDFIMEYVSTIAKFIDISKLPNDLKFYVMNKPAPEHDGKQHKDGVHIQCPNISTEPKFQYAIRGAMLQKNVIKTIFGDTELTNEEHDCFDVAVIHRNNWFLYGACKPNKAQYKIQRIINVPRKAFENVKIEEISDTVESNLEDLDIPDDSAEIMKELSIRVNHKDLTELVFRPESLTEYNHLVSLYGKGNAKLNKLDMISHTGKSKKVDDDDETVVSLIGDMTSGGAHTQEDIKLAYRLVRECLDPEKRCGDYNDWVNLGICLKNIANNPESLAVWSEITRKVDSKHKKASYTDAQLLAKWNLLKLSEREKQLRMGSIHYWAKEDNIDVYNSILGESIIDWIMHFASDSHVSVAKLVKKLYQHEFRCSMNAKRGGSEWYIYTNHIWVRLKKNVILRERLGEEVRNHFIKADTHLGTMVIKSTGPEKEVYENKRKLMFNIQKNLENTTFRDHVMKECESKYYDEKFIERLNMNPHLFACSNGVLELRHYESDDMSGGPKVLFRPGRPDDCISFQAGVYNDLEAIPYIPYDPEHPTEHHKFVLEFYRKVYPEEDLREYVLTLDAACLEGANNEQQLYEEKGNASNGKSKRQDLRQYTMGPYATSINVITFTRKRPDAGNANPDIITLKGVRYLYSGEPEEGEKLNSSLIKQWTTDTISARGLHADQEKFKIMGRIFIACNDLPPISSMDGGTWRRIRVIPHKAKFWNPGDPPVPADVPKEYIFPKDETLDTRFKTPEIRIAFLGILVYYFEHHYLKHGLIEPECVKEATMKYQKENDIFGAFIDENIIKEVGAGPIRMRDIMNRFDSWKKTMPGASAIKKGQIIERLKGIAAKGSTEKELYGLRLNDTEEDE
jgi:phage/plasmid-associated DNA primase